MRYGHAPTDERPLCHMPDSCTHIAGEFPDHDALRISRHNAACQLSADDVDAKCTASPRRMPDWVLKPDMAQLRTSYMQEGAQTLPPPTRPLSKGNSAPSSS